MLVKESSELTEYVCSGSPLGKEAKAALDPDKQNTVKVSV